MIGDGCFQEHRILSSVSFESGSVLEGIGELAFWWGKLAGSVVIPRSVRALSWSCVAGCRSLSSVEFESGSRVSEIGHWP
jgi:hypothetical protein